MDIVVLLGIVTLSLSLAAGLAGGVLYIVFSLMGLGGHESPGQPLTETYLRAEAIADARITTPIAA